MISGQTRVFGLFGHPVRHSLSPAMHTALFEHYGIDAVYVAFDVPPSRADRLAEAIRTLDVAGGNLTVPFKGAVLEHLDHATRAVDEAGAANVVIHHEGHLTGYNTDGEGFCRAWEEELGALPTQHAILLGAGGAARAVAASLADRGVRRLTFLNRSTERAQRAADHLAGLFPAATWDVGPLTAAGFAALAPGVDAVVNCTSGPASPTVETFDVTRLPAHCVWSDINYWMPDPPRLAACRAAGLRVQEGLGMLLHQGALSFELFTGQPVDVALIRKHLR